MSMNIHIYGKRDIMVLATGKMDVQYISYNSLQTPSNISDKIQQSQDFVQAYIDWIMEDIAQDQKEDLYFWETEEYNNNPDAYDWDEIENKIVGKKITNWGKEQIEDFKNWVQQAREQGFELYCEVI